MGSARATRSAPEGERSERDFISCRARLRDPKAGAEDRRKPCTRSAPSGTNGYPGGGVLERALLLPNRKPGDPHPFVDPAAWNMFIKQAQVNAAKTLEQEKQKAAAAR